MILKKGWFSYIEMIEIYQKISRELYQQNLTTWIETLNSEKQEPPTELKGKMMEIKAPYTPTPQ